ncbi:hypothetical protein [Kribbella jejuensis]|uniref:Uncharacterized protein n=2 Tax=Kribbella jejuensis TaxID=236068 RepID=A0A542EX41_9ACTN|nr:hypothetical protein [Kribbella jejuensis]TQJ19726.1 hypothetical protein FB475_3900 [Kribbella jejuensis]
MTEHADSVSELEVLTALLRHFDWSPTSHVPGAYEVWTERLRDSDDEVLLPLDPSRGDFAALLTKARRHLTRQYGRTADELLAILHTQTNAALDSTHWEKETSLTPGLIAWESGELLYESAKAQLVASAKASREKRRYHGNASAYVAKQFLESTLMGQTAIGSFIITAFTPSRQRFHLTQQSAKIATSTPRHSETLSGRNIMATFEHALVTARACLDEYKSKPDLGLFVEAVSDGISYEFAKALSDFCAGGDSGVSTNRSRADTEASQGISVAFDAPDSAVLAKAATTLALDPEPQSVVLVGEVTFLSHESGDPDRLIRLNIEEGATARKARVRLTEEQYQIAMYAHQNELRVQVAGEMEKEGHLFWIYEPDYVQILDESDQVPRVPSTSFEQEQLEF